MVNFLPPPIHETLKESLILMSSEVEPVSEMKLFVVVIAAALNSTDAYGGESCTDTFVSHNNER